MCAVFVRTRELTDIGSEPVPLFAPMNGARQLPT
jgi:hypothetical protein